MESADNFYVFLPSNSSFDYFPDNTLSNYKVKLPRAIDLYGAYEVSLVQTFFLSNWYNIVDNEGEINILTGKSWKNVYVNEGYYNKAENLIQEINNAISTSFGDDPQPKVRDGLPSISIDDFMNKIRATIDSEEKLRQKRLEMEAANQVLYNAKQKLETAEQELMNTRSTIESLSNASKKRQDEHKKKQKELDQKYLTYSRQPEKVLKEGEGPAVLYLEKIKNEIQENKINNEKLTKEEKTEIELLLAKAISSEKVYADLQLDIEDKQKLANLLLTELNLIEIKNKDNISIQEEARSRFIPKDARSKTYPHLLFDVSTRRVSIFLPPDSRIKFTKNVQQMLGFIPQNASFANLNADKMIYVNAPKSADMSSDLNSIYVYCNIIEAQYVGDKLVPLLRVIHLNDNDGVRVTKNFENPYYMPVTQRHIDTIEIQITDSFGRQIHFSSGDIVLNVLHFRRPPTL